MQKEQTEQNIASLRSTLTTSSYRTRFRRRPLPSSSRSTQARVLLLRAAKRATKPQWEDIPTARASHGPEDVPRKARPILKRADQTTTSAEKKVTITVASDDSDIGSDKPVTLVPNTASAASTLRDENPDKPKPTRAVAAPSKRRDMTRAPGCTCPEAPVHAHHFKKLWMLTTTTRRVEHLRLLVGMRIPSSHASFCDP